MYLYLINLLSDFFFLPTLRDPKFHIYMDKNAKVYVGTSTYGHGITKFKTFKKTIFRQRTALHNCLSHDPKEVPDKKYRELLLNKILIIFQIAV